MRPAVDHSAQAVIGQGSLGERNGADCRGLQAKGGVDFNNINAKLREKIITKIPIIVNDNQRKPKENNPP